MPNCKRGKTMRKDLSVSLSVLFILVSLSACSHTGAQAQSFLSAGTVESAVVETAQPVTIESASSSGAEAEAGEIRITLSDQGSSSDSASVQINGSTVTITEAGDYRVSGTLSNGQLRIQAAEDAKVRLILDGASVTCSGGAAIYAVTADKVVISTVENSSSLITSTGEFIQTDENNVDAAIFAKCDLTLKGEGALGVSCETGHGIVTKDDLKLNGGTVSVNAAGQGLSGKDSVTVSDGIFSIVCGTDGIHSDDTVLIEGGEISLSAGDDGIHADNTLTIGGGVLTIPQSYEGLEANNIVINDGIITIKASDDGINAAGGNDGSHAFGPFGGDPFRGDSGSTLTINGGQLTINAEGDGLDANGELLVTGGVIYVSGPTNNGNGALDYGTSAAITGGTVIAAGSSGMAENFGSGSTQGTILLNLSGSVPAGTLVSISDESGTVLASYTPEKSFSSVVISTEAMTVGNAYTVQIGSASTAIQLDSYVYGSGHGMGPGGMGGMGGSPGGGPPGGQGGGPPGGGRRP